MLTSSGGGGRSMLTVADRGRVKFAKILLTSYVNAPQTRSIYISTGIDALFISRLVKMRYLYLDWYRCPIYISTGIDVLFISRLVFTRITKFTF